MSNTNPHGANQFRADPRQELFLQYYFNPKSDTFSNALQSALRAGYAQDTAEQITANGTEWFAEATRDNNRLKKAEKVLDEMLELDVEQVKMTEDGEVTYRDPALVKIKQDTSKFVAERMGKHKYSNRTELTGKDGGPIETTPVNRESAEEALEAFIGEPIKQ